MAIRMAACIDIVVSWVVCKASATTMVPKSKEAAPTAKTEQKALQMTKAGRKPAGERPAAEKKPPSVITGSSLSPRNIISLVSDSGLGDGGLPRGSNTMKRQLSRIRSGFMLQQQRPLKGEGNVQYILAESSPSSTSQLTQQTTRGTPSQSLQLQQPQQQMQTVTSGQVSVKFDFDSVEDGSDPIMPYKNHQENQQALIGNLVANFEPLHGQQTVASFLMQLDFRECFVHQSTVNVPEE